ncbi:MAG: hypothetical protein SPG75_01225 [Megasphaera elsdenii]|nr:hypothetical protein [Megasphaera elsdenii]
MNTKDFQPEIFKLFDDQWGILTVGDKDAFNSMTISWGMLGTLWCMPHKGKNVCAVFVNPARIRMVSWKRATTTLSRSLTTRSSRKLSVSWEANPAGIWIKQRPAVSPQNIWSMA